ncbi:hypothetical protein FKP32DRAFT_1677260 [Trametes sanguinea]|nr:hypothetical protein FKP32DRAFT_1677260 [Trametes sanguinea]
MVVLSPHFTFLAALSSIAAVSLLPVPAEAAAIHLQSRDAFGQSIAARHSAHGGADDSADHQQSSSSKVKHASKKATVKKAAAKPQRHPKPVVPLPALMAQKSAHKGSSSSTEADGGDKKHTQAKSSKHLQSSRAAWESSDPVTRVQSLWLGSRDANPHNAAALPPRLSRRHHHDSHGHHHDEVIVKGNDDRVDMHHRSLEERRRSQSPRDDHDRITVEGHNDHVHDHNRGHNDHDHVVVKGDNDHVHVQRSPSPHHHHHHTNDRVIVKGDHDSVHMRRSPAPEPHSHKGHHDKVVVMGDHDHVKVHRRSSTPQRRHHHHTVVVKGNNEHVHVGRSPLPAPEPHHHHHHDKDRVIVKGDDDHVNVHGRRERAFGYRSPIVISGNGGDAFLLHHDMMSMSQASTYESDGDLLDMKLHLRRDGQVNGVPGSIEIMSPVANSDIGERIASLVMAAPSNGSTADNSTSSSFVLNASEGDRTQMYLVTVPDSGYATASATNGTTVNSTTPSSYIKVALQMPVFDAASAQLKPYCATFDPRPAAPAPMTVEYCMDGSTVDEHKSQAFAYKPDTGAIWPMWYDGEDDGTGGDDSAAPPADSDPSTTDGSDDGEGSTGGSDGTTVDPTTPTSDKVASVTSFNDEAMNEQYGDATRPPARAAFAKTFSADAISSARNVTLVFSPAAPEVPASPAAQKMAAPVSNSDMGTSSTASATVSDSSATSTSTDAATTSLADLAASSTLTPTDTSSDTPTSVASASSTTAASTSATDSDSAAEASATSSPALEVKVYNPYAEDVSSGPGSSSTSMATVSATMSSSTSSMTPVSTAPYEWMFKQGALTDLE